jgi:hypothetical protein
MRFVAIAALLALPCFADGVVSVQMYEFPGDSCLYGTGTPACSFTASPGQPLPAGLLEADAAAASFDERVTICGGTGSGYVYYLLGESFDCPASGSYCGFNFVQASGDTSDVATVLSPPGLSVAATYQTPFYSFTFGTPFELSLTADPGVISASILSTTVFNSGDQPIAFTETAAPLATPEPSSLILVGTTLVALTCGFLRKRLRNRVGEIVAP